MGIGMIIKLVLAAVVSYWIAKKTGTSFALVAMIIGGIVVVHWAHGKGWLGKAHPDAPAAAGHATHAGHRGHMFASFGHFMLWFAIFSALIMIFAWITEISPNRVTTAVIDAGWRFWWWPWNVALDVLAFICFAFPLAHIASHAAHGNGKAVGMIFLTTGIVIVLMTVLPKTGKQVLPTEKIDGEEKISKNATDERLSQTYTSSGGGVINGGGAVVASVLGGSTSTDIENDGWLLSPIKRVWRGATGKPKQPRARPREQHTTVVTTTTAAAQPPRKVTKTTPVEVTADYGFSLEADAPIMVQYPGEEAFLFTPGGDCKQLPQPRRSGPKKFWDPNDPENGKVSFRIYSGGGHC